MTRIVCGALVALMASAGAATAQERFSIEIVPRALFPAEQFAGTDLDRGVGIGAAFAVRLLPHFGPYVGWDWRHARAAESFAGPDVDVEETGYAFGVLFDHPFGARGSSLMIRVGGTYNHVEIETPNGDIVADSGHGYGWEAGAGVSLRIAERWSVVPGIRVRSLNRDITLANVTTPITLRSVALEIGFMRRF